MASPEKKSRYDPARDRPDVLAERAAFRALLPELPTAQIVVLDETCIHTAFSRDYARSRRGQRVYEARRTRPKATEKFTLVAALGVSGFVAPWQLQGALTGDAFLLYVEAVLLPELKPGQILMMDNLSCHKVAGIQEACDAAGVQLLYLPPYSPDFSPIEEAWSKLKAYLKAQAARTVEALTTALVQGLETLSLQDIWGWFSHAGYNMTDLR